MGDNEISEQEFIETFTKSGCKLGEGKLQILFASCDAAGTGKIPKAELVQMVQSAQETRFRQKFDWTTRRLFFSLRLAASCVAGLLGLGAIIAALRTGWRVVSMRCVEMQPWARREDQPALVPSRWRKRTFHRKNYSMVPCELES